MPHALPMASAYLLSGPFSHSRFISREVNSTPLQLQLCITDFYYCRSFEQQLHHSLAPCHKYTYSVCLWHHCYKINFIGITYSINLQHLQAKAINSQLPLQLHESLMKSHHKTGRQQFNKINFIGITYSINLQHLQAKAVNSQLPLQLHESPLYSRRKTRYQHSSKLETPRGSTNP